MATAAPGFFETAPQTGFYVKGSHRILVVPNGYSRTVFLKNAGGMKLTDFKYDAKKLTLTIKSNSKIQIKGRKVGLTSVRYKSGSHETKLFVRIVPVKYRTLHTWFIKHGPNATGITPPANNAPTVSQLNKVFWPQAGVWLLPGRVIDTTKVNVGILNDVDFWTPQQSGQSQGNIWMRLSIAAAGEGISSSAQNINVFFVKVWAARDQLQTCSDGTCAGGKNVLGTAGNKLHDNLTVIEAANILTMPFLLLAHEVCHNLGSYGHDEGVGTLMAPSINDVTTKLSLSTVLKIHGVSG